MAKPTAPKRHTKKTTPTETKSRAIKRKRADGPIDAPPPTKRHRKHGSEVPSNERVVHIKQETRDCDICVETKPVYRNFPELTVCSHPPTVCTECFKRHFITKVNEDREAGWSACSCPLCDADVPMEDAQAVLPRATAKEVNSLINDTHKHLAQNWIWCPGAGCGQGQLHTPGNKSKVTCKFCNIKICYKHQIKFHDMLTCDEYDNTLNFKPNELELRTKEEIQRTTKPCPKCKRRIQKRGGCNHMSCPGCHSSWLWDAVPFDGDTIATSAETRGGPAGAPSLQGGVRAAVEQVIEFENGQRARPAQGPPQRMRPAQDPPQRINNLEATLAAGRDRIMATMQTILQPIQAWRRELRAAVPQNLDDMRAMVHRPQEHDAGHLNTVLVRRPETAAGPERFAGLFNGFAQQVQHANVATAPTGNIRSARTGRPNRAQAIPLRGSRRPANPRRGRPRSSTAQVSDDRGQQSQTREVIDLTGEGNVTENVIDLTLDD